MLAQAQTEIRVRHQLSSGYEPSQTCYGDAREMILICSEPGILYFLARQGIDLSKCQNRNSVEGLS